MIVFCNFYIYQAKVRARLSRPLQRGKGKHAGRADFWPGRSSGRAVRGSWGRPAPRSLSVRGVRGVGSHFPPVSVKRPGGVRDRRPVIAVPVRGRQIAPVARSYDRGPPGMYLLLLNYKCHIFIEAS